MKRSEECAHPDLSRRDVLKAGLLTTGLGLAEFLPTQPCPGAEAGQTLYNGIRLPEPWPPRPRSLTREPVLPPYLRTPPAVIPINVGRQLFVDDFLVETTTLRRT